MRQRGWRLALKRGVDACAAGASLVATAPLMAGVALLIRTRLGSPVLFRQERPGRGGVPFELVKFRTMLDHCDSEGNPLPDSERLTAFGRLLRSTSVDELPQLWNVLVGDMSLVGPRPLLMRYLERYSPEQARRHAVLPGITGLAQVKGRNALSWEQKFSLDVQYVDDWSLALDLYILSLTLKQVLLREGVSSAGHATMPEFLGSEAASQAAGQS